MRRSALAAALTAAALLATVATPASARTWHHTHTYLHFPARAADAKVMTDRVIRLRGLYMWRAFSAHWAHEDNPARNSRIVRLNGRYQWRDYLVREGRVYKHYSTLRNMKTGGRVTLSHIEPGRARDGSYHWGSTLLNTRTGTTEPS